MKLFLLIFFYWFTATCLFASDFEATNSDGLTLYYNVLSTTECEVTSSPYGGGYNGPISIPESVIYKNKKLKVTRIGDYAFSRSSNIEYIYIPNTIRSIGRYVFEGISGFGAFSNILIVEYQDEETMFLLDIEDKKSNPLMYAQKLLIKGIETRKIKVPNTITEIKDYAFYYFKWLEEIELPESIKKIGEHSFYGCERLTNINFPLSLQSIGESSFYGCSLSKIILRDNVSAIEKGAFENCSKAKEIVLPSSLECIKESSFQGCSNVELLTLGSQVKEIGKYSFFGCESLTTLKVEANLPPVIESSSFQKNLLNTFIPITLIVPKGTKSIYEAKLFWKDFWEIIEFSGSETSDSDIITKCSTPLISYQNGKIIFSCSTPDVNYLSSIICEDINNSFETPEIDLSRTYLVSVIAQKEGLDPSDIAKATLCWIDCNHENESIDISSITTNTFLITFSGSSVNISGVIDTNSIEFYNLSGSLIGVSQVIDGQAKFETDVDLLIIKIGEKTIKIIK